MNLLFKLLKKDIVLLVFGFFSLFSINIYAQTNSKKICLTMVVKDDATTIQDCLNCVKNQIDCVAICDRGSSDNTVEVIKQFMEKNGIPGKVVSYEWVKADLSFYETFTVRMAQKILSEMGFSLPNTYLLALESSQRAKIYPGFKKDSLQSDSYLICERTPNFSCNHTHLLKASLPWEKVGVAYSYWSVNQKPYLEGEVVKSWVIHNNESESQKTKIEEDIKALTAALLEETENSRYMFFLARSNQLLGKFEEAIKWYEKRIKTDGRKEETWCAKYMMGECYEALGQWDKALQLYMESFEENPVRLEPLYRMTHHYRVKGNNDLARLFAVNGKTLDYPNQNLFINHRAYDYLFNEELSIISFYTKHKKDGLAAVDQLINKCNVPPHLKEEAYRNVFFYIQNLENASYIPVNKEKLLQADFCPGQNVVIYSKPTLEMNAPLHNFSRFKSSCSPIEWENGFLMLVYEEVKVDNKMHHIHRFLKLNDCFFLEGFSKPFIFKHYGLEVCGGMKIDDSRNKLMIPLMIEGKDLFICEAQLDSIKKIIDPFSISQGQYQVISNKFNHFQELSTELKKLNSQECKKDNPFAIDFKPKENLTNEDYIVIQNQLRALKISPYIKERYPFDRAQDYTTLEDFENRSTVGTRQIMIDPEKGFYPIQKLEKIGNGSDMCVISFSSYNKAYPSYIRSIPDNLRKTGFNGYFLYQIGGYPNPTGQEIQYAGTPYAFKIFMMMEAYKLGFNKILWIDSVMVPLNDPTPLFAKIEKKGAFFNGWWGPEFAKYILPQTRKILKDMTGTDVVDPIHAYAPVLGLDMDSDKGRSFVKSYYEMAAKGTPFLSCAPEEFVFTAILGYDKFKDCRAEHQDKLLHCALWGGKETPEEIENLRKQGYYFYHHSH